MKLMVPKLTVPETANGKRELYNNFGNRSGRRPTKADKKDEDDRALRSTDVRGTSTFCR